MANSSIVIFKITGNKNEVNELKEKLDFVVEKHKGAGYVSFAFRMRNMVLNTKK